MITLGFLWNRLRESLPDVARDALDIAAVDENWLPITKADAGMCGGMVYAVMDYWHHKLLPPTTAQSPSSSEDPLFQYIRSRLWDSFDVGGRGHRFLGYSSPHYPNGDEGFVQAVGLSRGRSWVTYREEWPRIRADIDSGRLSPIGLIQTDSLEIGNNHQVLAYGYEQSGQRVRLLIYDPNLATQSGELLFDITDTSGEVHIACVPASGPRIFCLFRIDGYEPKLPVGGWTASTHRSSSAGIAAVARTPNHLDVFWAGPDGAIGSQWWDAAPGAGWADHKPFSITPPGAAG